jgi:uncharacterized membrane protein YkoI
MSIQLAAFCALLLFAACGRQAPSDQGPPGATASSHDDDDDEGPAVQPPANLKVSMDAARQTALAQVPGQVVEEEVEEEDGRWVYEFDIVTAAGAPVKEVVVDADTGQVVKVEDDD